MPARIAGSGVHSEGAGDMSPSKPRPVVCALTLALVTAGCCSFGAFDHIVEVGAPTMQVDGPPSYPYPAFVTVTGASAQLTAQARETYFGDAGCDPEGPLGPGSRREPEAYSWESTDLSVATVDGFGQFTAHAEGATVIQVRSDRVDDVGQLELRVLPPFASIDVQPTTTTVSVGDTVSFTVRALDETGALVPAITARSAGLFLRPPPGPNPVVSNTIFSELESSPVRFVFLANGPGTAELTATVRVMGREHLAGTATVTVVP